jgi:HPt (histidine-containing phosphotransfer) domain-containing protein
MEQRMIYFNQEEGLKRVVNNKKLYLRLLNSFKADESFTHLLDYIQAQDYEKAQSAAHTVKGISGNLSLTALYEQSITLESQLKSGSAEAAAVESITACYNETIKAVDEVIRVNG